MLETSLSLCWSSKRAYWFLFCLTSCAILSPALLNSFTDAMISSIELCLIISMLIQ